MKQHLQIGAGFLFFFFFLIRRQAVQLHAQEWMSSEAIAIITASRKYASAWWEEVLFLKDGNAGGGAGCPQVPLIKGNLNSPPCSYLCTGACSSSAADWCNELHRCTLDALQDGPCRAIMSTPAHQYMLPEPPFHKYGVGTCWHQNPSVESSSTSSAIRR